MRDTFELEQIDTPGGAAEMRRVGWNSDIRHIGPSFAKATEGGRRRGMLRVALVCAGIVVGIMMGLAMAGCTIAPKTVKAGAVSWDGTNQNGGVIMLVPGGAVITEGAAERYNGLILIYGGKFVPAMRKDDGLSGPVGVDQGRPTWRITNEGMARFATMTRWRREGR